MYKGSRGRRSELSLKIILYPYIESGSHGGFLAAKSYYDSIESGCQGGFPGNQETTKLRPCLLFIQPYSRIIHRDDS